MSINSVVLSLWNFLDSWVVIFCILWIWRYLRTIVHFVSHLNYKSMPIVLNPKYTNRDVTVIIPTIEKNLESLRGPIQSILACNPSEVLLVTTYAKYNKLIMFVKTLEASNIRVFRSPIANKRRQVCEAIPEVKTEIIVQADDDVTWPEGILPWILAPFQDATIGAVGTNQRVKRIHSGPLSARTWNWLAAMYIQRRNFEISATHGIDGGTSCMSGRTVAIRSKIIQCPNFMEAFLAEQWRSNTMNADDDNFVTRWLVSHHWKTWVQYDRACEIETTLENNPKFLYQCLRWARSNWRSNYTSLVKEKHVIRQQPWCTYALHLTTFTSLSFVFDPLILLWTWNISAELPGNGQYYALAAQTTFMLWTKLIKPFPLFVRNPTDILFFPVTVLFGYFHGLIKIWALITINNTAWGSREDGDKHDEERMKPRHLSEAMDLPADNRPGLPRWRDEKECDSLKQAVSSLPCELGTAQSVQEHALGLVTQVAIQVPATAQPADVVGRQQLADSRKAVEKVSEKKQALETQLRGLREQLQQMMEDSRGILLADEINVSNSLNSTLER